jgi:L-seryl-tRNA(Ser) seleniumtransferase
MREIPAVHRVLSEPVVAAYEALLGRATVKRAVERALDRARAGGDAADVLFSVVEELEGERTSGLVRAVNGTGIIVHTNLGRVPLAREALAAIERFASGYSNLEFDLVAGERGSRYERVSGLLREVTGASDALVVNNCAAAVLLVLDAFAKGREVIVARGQLIEIGGGFRIPEVLERSGARLVEVGTTNRVYLRDFERALSPRTALVLRTHPSNFRIQGFTHEVGGAELVRLGKRAGVPVVEDLGGGALVDLAEYGLPHERTVQDALAEGIDLVTFSGDKLLGGPQSGIIVGNAHLIARLRGNPLVRALRVDKMTLAGLAATLRLYGERASRERIPLFRMLATPLESLRARAQAYVCAVPGSAIVQSEAYVGGGSLPQARVASIAVAYECARPDELAARLRMRDPAIVARIEGGRLLLDLRTIAPEEDAAAIAALSAVTR